MVFHRLGPRVILPVSAVKGLSLVEHCMLQRHPFERKRALARADGYVFSLGHGTCVWVPGVLGLGRWYQYVATLLALKTSDIIQTHWG